MNYFDRIQKSIDFIDNNLKENITVQQIAMQSYFSMTHFYRIFQAIVGDTLKSYIRKRRLSNAAFELIKTDKRIVDIAFVYQFQSQEVQSVPFVKDNLKKDYEALRR